jgi:hypothetical protein
MIHEGRGIVRVLGGDTYEGDFEIRGRWVTLGGRNRKPQASGEVYHGPPWVWTWPESRVLAIVEQVAP